MSTADPVDPIDHLRHEEAGLSPGHPVKRFRRMFPTDRLIRLHYHSSLEINFCRDVSGKVRINDWSFDPAPHTLIILPPDTLHSYQIEACRGSIEVVHIELRMLEEWINLSAVQDFLRRLSPQNLVFTGEKDVPLSVESLPSSSFGVASLLFRLMQILDSRTRFPYSGRAQWLKQLVDFTEAHYQEPLSLERAAAVAGLSRSCFARRFRRETGVTFHRFLLQVRLEQARSCLQQGCSVTDAALECGFTDASHLIRHFRKEFGMTPGKVSPGPAFSPSQCRSVHP